MFWIFRSKILSISVIMIKSSVSKILRTWDCLQSSMFRSERQRHSFWTCWSSQTLVLHIIRYYSISEWCTNQPPLTHEKMEEIKRKRSISIWKRIDNCVPLLWKRRYKMKVYATTHTNKNTHTNTHSKFNICIMVDVIGGRGGQTKVSSIYLCTRRFQVGAGRNVNRQILVLMVC